MEHKEKIELAKHLLDNLFERVFDDDARVLSMLNMPGKSPDALVAYLGNSMRYVALSLLKDKLDIKSLEPGIDSLIDRLEERSVKHMRYLVSKYLAKDEMSMSDMLRPGRKV